MNKRIVVIGYLFLLTFSITGQCLKYYEYKGAPGSILEDSISTESEALIYFDFSTYDIPDKITIYTCSDSFSFYTGSANDHPGYTFINGFGLIEILGNSWYLHTQNDTIPSNFSGDKYSEGSIRIIYRTECCKVKWRLEGNEKHYTVFTLCVKLMEKFQAIVDTIEIPYCGPAYNMLVNDTCNFIMKKYLDFRIADLPVIKNPSCAGRIDGSIEFDNYQYVNRYNLGSGKYSILVSNGICSKKFDITLKPQEECHVYIPNVFTPNEDGENDEFIMYTDTDVEYEIFIYSRWGGLIYRGTHTTNQNGWNPIDKFLPGVYAYKIITKTNQFSGDVTLIR